MEYLSTKINLRNEFQRIIDSGWKHNFSSEQYEEKFLLYKPSHTNNTDISNKVDEYKTFITIFEDFSVVSQMIMSNPIDKVKYFIEETPELFGFISTLEKPTKNLVDDWKFDGFHSYKNLDDVSYYMGSDGYYRSPISRKEEILDHFIRIRNGGGFGQ